MSAEEATERRLAEKMARAVGGVHPDMPIPGMKSVSPVAAAKRVLAYLDSNPDALSTLLAGRPVEERLLTAIGDDYQEVATAVAHALEGCHVGDPTISTSRSRQLATVVMARLGRPVAVPEEER